MRRWGALVRGDRGQDMVEYALLAALISMVALAIIVLVEPYLAHLFQDVVNAPPGATAPPPCRPPPAPSHNPHC